MLGARVQRRAPHKACPSVSHRALPSVQMELTEPVSKLQEYAEMVTGIPQSHQLLVHNTKAVPLNGSIGSAQIGSGDMIIVVKQSPEDREKMMQQQHQVCC